MCQRALGRVVARQLEARFREERKPRDQPLDLPVIDLLGVELPLYPVIDAELADPLQIAGPRSEGEAVEDVADLLVGGLLAYSFIGRSRSLEHRWIRLPCPKLRGPGTDACRQGEDDGNQR